jgi:predicted amidophosphoribosyltransferase
MDIDRASASAKRLRALTFGQCARCPLLDIALPEACYRCARLHAPALASKRCPICDDRIEPGTRCGRPLCRLDEVDRGWRTVWAIHSHAGAMRSAIDQLKYRGDARWARVFAALVVGYLDAHPEDFGRFDLVAASPTFRAPGSARLDHTQFVLAHAAQMSERWPWARGVVRKTAPTRQLAGLPFRERGAVADGELRQALSVPDPARVAGQRVLVYDDVMTTGLTLREVALCLRRAGAIEVSGLVLARRPYVARD